MKKKTHEEYVRELEVFNPNIEVVGQYINARTKIMHRCKLDNHKWEVTPNNILRGKGCPLCLGNRAISEVNDLQTLCPDLIQEWNWNKNNELNLKPNKFKAKSNTKVWWICKNGHEWQATIASRSCGAGCPICAKEYGISEPEIKLYFYLKKYFTDAILGYEDKQNQLSELDIYIPSINYGFEYDGERWHLNSIKDKKKDDICKQLGIKLVRIREPKCPKYESSCRFIYLKNLKESALAEIIVYLLEMLGVENPNVCFKNDMAKIQSLISYQIKQNSLIEKYPSIAAQWHPIKNGSLMPNKISCHSGKKVWWVCDKCGHEWISKVSSRTDGNGCPECAKEKISNSLSKTVYCIELDRCFKSMTSAAKCIGINTEGIYVCCIGKRKSAGKHPITQEKLHWYYVKDQIQKDGTRIKGAISLGLVTRQQYEEFLSRTVQN